MTWSNRTIRIKLWIECRYCNGEGKYVGLHKVEDPCKNCDGKGKIKNFGSSGNTVTLWKGGKSGG